MCNLSDNEKLKKRPIGFMDSGVGGLSVLREAVRVLPAEDFIYFGDSANAPYGTKTVKEIRDLTFKAVEKLMDYDIKALVVACNTATSAAISDLRAKYKDIPVIGIEPAVKPAVVCSRGGRIIVMATPMTLRQRKFRELIKTYENEADIVPLACEGLMEYVENGVSDKEGLMTYLDKTLGPFVTGDTESIVLGCTHYPFIINEIKEYLGDRSIVLIDGSKGTSSQLKRRLEEKDLLRDPDHSGHVTILNSSDDPEMIELSKRLLEQNDPEVKND